MIKDELGAIPVILGIIKIFTLPLAILGIVNEPTNYWQWVLTAFIFYI